jgi:hypothetical protein
MPKFTKTTNTGSGLLTEDIKRKRGRPPGTKNKPKDKKVIKGTETDKVYRYYFIADACGCRYGVNVIGSGMWCEHKNSMHLEDRKKYTEQEYTGI